MRTRVYDAIVALLSDRNWHWASEIGKVTAYHEEWLRELTKDPLFEFDGTNAMIRLRGSDA